MSDPITSLGASTGLSTGSVTNRNRTESGPAFGELLQKMVTDTVSAQHNAADVSARAASGEDIPMQDVIQSLNRADITLQTMVTLRDRAVEAYQEMIRMPI